MRKTNIAIFASGSGTNAEAIINHFSDNQSINISLVLSNKPDAFVLTRAKNHNIPTVTFDRPAFYSTNKIIDQLNDHNIDFIVLAGFLWLIPENIIKNHKGSIVNIHPALLPKYGGKGMFGDKVHKAVIENAETESGITIHFVNEQYDEGQVILQAKCKVVVNDTHETLAEKIHLLEHKHFPKVIEKVISDRSNTEPDNS